MTQHAFTIQPRRLAAAFLLLVLAASPGCTGGGTKGEAVGKYEVLPTLTDDGHAHKCKSNAEDTLTRHPDVKCMAGLWAYNPPNILAAIRDAGKLGQVKIVAFDENEETLEGIKAGHIYGTVVQDPYNFGFESIRLLAALARGNKSVLPPNGIHFIEHRIIKKDNVDAFHAELKERKGKPAKPIQADPEAAKLRRVKVAFITNNPHEFWLIAKRGCEDAAAKFNVELDFRMPQGGTVAEQNQFIQEMLVSKIEGIAISPCSGDQLRYLNEVADKVPLITQDSDLPAGAKRLCYLGTDNVKAGRAVGKLIREVIPEGGKVAIYVGSLDKQNAIEREKGLKEGLKE
jgi:ribose transport system substrate-binding protein